eukprot:CAMPEP_0197554386 /NCGR_PEP_ID=MMETSP1320-20131121/11251_1 /TAXON_ID=91990 /ORGANISM="Bolidomonas sp., Strain RCC2347" /LENGTH=221 /DNA_ID=CAMNT_0043115265 /DNA_START=420 /DNA_END=1081 /DNA_ORIENTATION=-
MKSGKVVEWLVQEGDTVESGDSIATIESDKADMDLESFSEGRLLKILINDGEEAAVGSPIAVILEDGEDEATLLQALSGGASGESSSSSAPPSSAGSDQGPVPPPAADGDAQEPDTPHTKVYMPALSSTMTSGKVVSWEVSPGDFVESGSPLLTVESDKADMEVEHLGDDGYLAVVAVDDGESCDVGDVVAVIVEKEEDAKLWEGWAPGQAGGGVSTPGPA